VATAGGVSTEEAHAFELCALQLPQANVSRLAWTTSSPTEIVAAVRIGIGRGTLTILASPFGIPVASVKHEQVPCGSVNANACCGKCPTPAGSAGAGSWAESIWSLPNEHLANPFPLLRHARTVIDLALRREVLFEAGAGLAVAVNRRAAGDYTVTLAGVDTVILTENDSNDSKMTV
jgi:hypothetical protein